MRAPHANAVRKGGRPLHIRNAGFGVVSSDAEVQRRYRILPELRHAVLAGLSIQLASTWTGAGGPVRPRSLQN